MYGISPEWPVASSTKCRCGGLSLFHMREARGWALLGDTGATDRAIVRAHHLYAKGPADADPAWLDFFQPGELAGLEARPGPIWGSTSGPPPAPSRRSCCTAPPSRATAPCARRTSPSSMR
ncbi:hypothetical protein GCM10018772_68920 [Streptomyces fumanus]|uniref:Uncharacterized protein n=1 Tax=Streptomyces fumanus TaxID=67302 RepID=A0A919B0W0_9ACTN|nr:hypothetical protein GCM10018772_68920 [Streptomyces fumanus]